MLNEEKRQPQGLVGGAMAMPEAEAAEAEATEPTEALSNDGKQDVSGQMTDVVERVLVAAVRVLRTPEGKQELMEAAQAPEPEAALQRLSASIVLGIDEKTGQTLPDEALGDAAQQVAQMMAGLLSGE